VEPEKILIPAWAQILRPADFDYDPRRCWLPRWAAKIIKAEDEAEGGKCSVIKTEYTRCETCGRLLIQLQAERKRSSCGPDCKPRKAQR